MKIIIFFILASFWQCSPLFNTRVVLRRLVSTGAKRRGKRAIEVCWMMLLNR